MASKSTAVANHLLGWAAVLLASSCVAALWSLLPTIIALMVAGMPKPALFMGVMAPLVGLLAVLILGVNGMTASAIRGVCAVLLFVAMGVYANYVVSAGMIAGSMAFNQFESMQRIGLDMALALARSQQSVVSLALYAVGATLAFFFGVAGFSRRARLK